MGYIYGIIKYISVIFVTTNQAQITLCLCKAYVLIILDILRFLFHCRSEGPEFGSNSTFIGSSVFIGHLGSSTVLITSFLFLPSWFHLTVWCWTLLNITHFTYISFNWLIVWWGWWVQSLVFFIFSYNHNRCSYFNE